MNRYPWWKYAILGLALVIGLLYTLPNFYGEAPAVQVSSGKATLKVDPHMVERVEQALKAAGIRPTSCSSTATRCGPLRRHRHPDQGQGRDLPALNPDPADPSYIVALNLLSRSPAWLASCTRCRCTWAWTCAAACTS
jgi:preprotein translocase subunit SecD